MSSASVQGDFPAEIRFARRISQASVTPPGGAERAQLTLAYGLPDPGLFPTADLAAATARVMADPGLGVSALQYGRGQGQSQTISLIAAKISHDEGLALPPANIMVTSGASGAIGLVARAFLDEGDVALVEGPTFPGAMNVLRRAGATLQEAPVGPDGIDLAATESLLDSLHVRGIYPRLLYTQPTFHNPVGVTMSEAARGALLGLARRYNLVILEDDAYRDLDYDRQGGSLPPSLYALDREGRVVRTGTFSKILAPGMRLGWAIARPEIIGRMLLLKEEGATNPFAQMVAVEYGRDGALLAHIERLVEVYRQKRDLTLDALSQYFPEEATWTRPRGGFFVWVTLPAAVEPGLLARLAREEGVDYLAGQACFADPSSHRGTYLRLAFSLLGPDELEEAIKRLGRVVKSLL